MLSPFKTTRAESKDSARLGLAYASYAIVCCAATKMTAGHTSAATAQSPCCVCFCYVFAHEFLFNPHFDLEPDYSIRKSIIHRILRYIPRREILSTFHTRVDNRSIRHFCIVFTPKLPLPLRRSPPKSNTPIPSSILLTTPNGIRIQSAVSPQFTCGD